jgi:RHS repeat-associated protein
MSGYSTGGDNRLTTDGTWNYSYDNEGNRIGKTNISTGENWVYAYDNANELVSATDKDSSGNVIQQVTFKYDAFENLVEQDVFVASTNTTTVTKFAYNGQDVWADLNGSNSLVMRRLYLDGVNQPFARIASSGVAAWYLADHLGSIRAIQSNSTGSLIDQITYGAFGNVVSESQPANGDSRKFAGGFFQGALGLYHFDWRWVDPVTGTWISEDPTGLEPDSNLYRDVGNGPTNGSDPSGLDEVKGLSGSIQFDAKQARFNAVKGVIISVFLHARSRDLTKTQFAQLSQITVVGTLDDLNLFEPPGEGFFGTDEVLKMMKKAGREKLAKEAFKNGSEAITLPPYLVALLRRIQYLPFMMKCLNS